MQNLIEFLKTFNSKERFYLAGQILGNSNFTLSADFCNNLSNLLEIPIPADAFSAMDYHIDWLYASLYLAKDESKATIYLNDNNCIKGNQEDIDWLIAFEIQGEYHLILIEAKGVTKWSISQLNSKANRFRNIFGDHGNNWNGVVPHFVIMSSSRPAGLPVDKLPKWMAPNGTIKWLKLLIPNLVCVNRCNGQGVEDKYGLFWEVNNR